MEELLKALRIFKKYKNVEKPISCALNTLMIEEITKDMVGEEDQNKLSELNFEWDDEYQCWLKNL